MNSVKNLSNARRIQLARDHDVASINSHVAKRGWIFEFGTILGQCLVETNLAVDLWRSQGMKSAAYSLESPQRVRVYIA